MDLKRFRNLISLAPTSNPSTSIWAIPFAAFVIAGSVLAWVSYDEYQETLEQEYLFLDAHARIAQNQVANLVRNVRQVLTSVAELSKSPVARGPAYAARLRQLNHDVPEIRTLAVLDRSGRVEVAANPSLVGFDGSKREYFTTHQGGPRQFDLHISRPYKSVYGDYSVGFSLPLVDERQQITGIAVAGIHYNYFDGAVRDIRPALPRSTFAIVNDDGDFLYHQPDPEITVGKNVSANESFQRFLHSQRTTIYDTAISQTDGLRRMYVHRAIADTPLSISISLPVDDALATWRRNLILRIALFILGSGLILRLTATAHRRQQEALESREFTNRLMQTANAMMVGVDSEGMVIAVNEATERVTGYRSDELMGRSFFDTIMPRERFPRAWNAFLDYRQTGEVPRAIDAPILTRSGEKRIVAWQNSTVFTHGDSLAVLSFGIDVTERVQLQQMRNREEVSRRLVGIHEEERRLLAVELHDRTSPNLTVLDFNLRALAGALPPDASPQLADLIEDTSATLRDTIASIRAVSFDFRPPLLDYAGLWPALSAYARQFNRRTGIVVQMAGKESPRSAPEIETNLFRIAQEALANCALHSRAGRVLISQTRDDDEIRLTVADDGIGFDAEREWGQGLTTMRQRAQFIGGRLELETLPGEGTRITVSIHAALAVVPATV